RAGCGRRAQQAPQGGRRWSSCCLLLVLQVAHEATAQRGDEVGLAQRPDLALAARAALRPRPDREMCAGLTPLHHAWLVADLGAACSMVRPTRYLDAQDAERRNRDDIDTAEQVALER